VLLLFYYLALRLVAESGNLPLERCLYTEELIGEQGMLLVR
jgi:hypothetical protein